MKMLTVCIPCYNSAAYMRHAIESVLRAAQKSDAGEEEYEIIIIDDGSKDDTGVIADEYERRYPGIFRAVHQENGGHGEAVNCGIELAQGMYYKVVDSDDWLDSDALVHIMGILHMQQNAGDLPDAVISNYVYEKPGEGKRKVINYHGAIPSGRMFTWQEAKHFRTGHYLLMHSLIYRTQLLRDCGLKLPKHTFYVDNIYAYLPLAFVNRMYYADVNLYRYYIGRADQSVSEKNMIGRIDQQLAITYYMIDNCDVMKMQPIMRREYMLGYLSIMMTVSSIYLIKEGSASSLQKRDALWEYVRKNPPLFRALSSGIIAHAMQAKSAIGRKIACCGYSLSKKIFKFG